MYVRSSIYFLGFSLLICKISMIFRRMNDFFMKKHEKVWKIWKRMKKDEKWWKRMKKDEKGWKRIKKDKKEWKKMKKDEKVLKPIHYVALYFERDNSPQNFFRLVLCSEIFCLFWWIFAKMLHFLIPHFPEIFFLFFFAKFSYYFFFAKFSHYFFSRNFRYSPFSLETLVKTRVLVALGLSKNQSTWFFNC